MISLRSVLLFFSSEVFWRKMIAYATIILIGYLLRDFLVLFFITFIFAYIFLELGEYLSEKIHSWGTSGKPDRMHRIAKKYATTNIVITVLYALFIGVLTFIFITLVPQLGNEIKGFLQNAPRIATQAQDFLEKIEQSTGIELGLDQMAQGIFDSKTLEGIGQQAFTIIKNAGVIFTKFLVALILSYVFLIDRKRVEEFVSRIRGGNFRFFYEEWAIMAKKIGNGFGLIFKAQSIIALVNSILTALGLIIISFFHGGEPFPFLVTLALIVFICGFIPVFGAFISGVPILFIAYGYGSQIGDGMGTVLAVVVMITLIHMIEAYYLNPKIVSSYVHFPIFVTFIILLVSEHFFGFIGLLIGVPTFLILLGLIEDIDRYIEQQKHKKHTHVHAPNIH